MVLLLSWVLDTGAGRFWPSFRPHDELPLLDYQLVRRRANQEPKTPSVRGIGLGWVGLALDMENQFNIMYNLGIGLCMENKIIYNLVHAHPV